MSNNWSPDLQMWCYLLYTPTSQAPSIPDEGTCPIGQDWAKAVGRKGKGKEGSSSERKSSSAMGGIMSTLKKLITSFAKV
jgi:hypothetical protein